MSFDDLRGLIVETITTPAQAARKVLAFDVPRSALWSALALIAILNGIYYGLLLPGAARAGLVPVALANAPLMVTAGIFVVLTVLIYALMVTGRMLGGIGDLDALMKVTIWLQGLRVLAQVAISVLSVIIPALGWALAMAVGIWGLWILVVFVATAHGFAPLKGVGTLIAGFAITVLVMSVLTALMGFGVQPGEI